MVFDRGDLRVQMWFLIHTRADFSWLTIKWRCCPTCIINILRILDKMGFRMFTLLRLLEHVIETSAHDWEELVYFGMFLLWFLLNFFSFFAEILVILIIRLILIIANVTIVHIWSGLTVPFFLCNSSDLIISSLFNSTNNISFNLIRSHF